MEHFQLASEFFNQDNFKEAVEQFTKCIDKTNNDSLLFWRSYLARSLAYYNMDQFDKSIQDSSTMIAHFEPLLKNLSQKDPEFELLARSYAIRAKSLKQKSKQEWYNAERDFSSAISLYEKLNSSKPTLYLQRALIYDSQKQYEESVRDYSKFLTLVENPLEGQEYVSLYQKFQGYYNRALTYISTKDWQQAKQDLEQASMLSVEIQHSDENLFQSVKDEFAEMYYQLGLCCQHSKEKALDYFVKSLELNPSHIAATTAAAYDYYDQKQFDEAVKYFSKLIDWNEADTTSLFNRALCYRQLREYAKAVRDLQKAQNLNPKDGKLYSVQARTLRLQQDIEQRHREESFTNEIISQYGKAIELLANDAQELATLFFERANLYNKIGKFNEAIDDFSKSIAIDDSNSDCFFNRGLIYSYELQDYEKALEDLNKASELNPNDLDAVCEKGMVYYHMDKRELAMAQFTTVLNKQPSHPVAKRCMDLLKE